jgi:hypothetical protein
MTSIAAPHAAVRTSTRKPRAFATARRAVSRPFRGFAAAARLERQRTIEDPTVLLALLRG